MKTLLPKLADVICFVVGPFITVFSIFSFEGGGSGTRMIDKGFHSSGYSYSVESKIGIGIGVALICIGLLRKHWKKHKEKMNP